MTTGDFTGTRAPGGVPHWHTVRRSRLFTVLPAVVLGLLGVNFVWEAVRRNVDVAGPWLPYQTFQEELAARGVRPADAEFFWLGRAPLPPQPKLTEGYRLGSFTVDGLVQCDPFEIRIQADDQLGDRHRLVINSTARLPVPAWSQVVRTRADTPSH
ncbi:hypothetical protein ACN268_05170 [Micromonospora sp. WMMD735]|uniref:hypothetical protein n=1 Tax=Micromonospora sp. WMMD735 TaxID=3404130 RepID=UPI003B9661A0